jgi:hypothetical protein
MVLLAVSGTVVNKERQRMLIDYVISDLSCRQSIFLENLQQNG